MKEPESVSVGEEGRAFMVIVLEDPFVWVWSELIISMQHEGICTLQRCMLHGNQPGGAESSAVSAPEFVINM